MRLLRSDGAQDHFHRLYHHCRLNDWIKGLEYVEKPVLFVDYPTKRFPGHADICGIFHFTSGEEDDEVFSSICGLLWRDYTPDANPSFPGNFRIGTMRDLQDRPNLGCPVNNWMVDQWLYGEDFRNFKGVAAERTWQ